MQKILIVGFPYVRERYFATFRHWPVKGAISFLLPTKWSAKDGKVTFTPPADTNITTTEAYFSHSHYPVIGGLLKGFMPGFLPYLWRNRRQVDLVYGCSEPTLLTTLLFALTSKLLGKKFVCFSWENIPYEEKFTGPSRLVHSVILRLNLFLSDGLVCGNKAGADIHLAYTRKPIEVIPMNGLDTDAFRPNSELRRNSHLSGKTVYTFVGAIGYRKGIHLILQALPEVLKEVPTAHLVIAGGGEYDAEIKRLIDEPFIREHVTRFGWVEHHELVRLLAVSDVFVYPSIPYQGWAEQFGYSMAEASLMELPVISTSTGSIGDVVLDGTTGTLVPPDDVGALMSAMVRLGTDAALRARLGKAGREHIAKHFSHEVVARRYSEFLGSIIDAKS